MLIIGNVQFSSLKEGAIYIVKHLLFVNSLFGDTFFDRINGVLWSLSVEIQFYILFPLICWVFRKKPFHVFILGNVFSIGYRYYVETCKYNQLSFLFNQLPGVLDLFLSGMLGAYLFVFLQHMLLKSKEQRTEKLEQCSRPYVAFIIRNINIIMTIISISMFVAFALMLKWLSKVCYNPGGVQLWQLETRHYIAWIFLLMVIPACFSYRLWQRIVANRILVFLSAISYNLYLWHDFLILKLRDKRILNSFTEDQHNDKVWQIKYTILSYVISILIATIITYGFERPLLKETWRNFKYFKHKKNR